MADVNGNITPSGEEIQLVAADEWGDMTISQLLDQRTILNNRLVIISQYGNPNMIKQVQSGLAQLDLVLKYKQTHKKHKNKKEKALTGLI